VELQTFFLKQNQLKLNVISLITLQVTFVVIKSHAYININNKVTISINKSKILRRTTTIITITVKYNSTRQKQQSYTSTVLKQCIPLQTTTGEYVKNSNVK